MILQNLASKSTDLNRYALGMGDTVFIKRIVSVSGLATFSAYEASDDLPELRQHNLFYGFNGAGKSSIATLLAGIGDESSGAEFDEAIKFRIELSDGTFISKFDAQSSLKGRLFVFNKKFVADNFKWDESRANPIFYIGTKQREASLELEKIIAETKRLKSELDETEITASQAESEFAAFKTDVARGIASELGLGRNFTAHHLVNKYADSSLGSGDHISDSDQERARSVIGLHEAGPALNRIRSPATMLSQSLHAFVSICGEAVQGAILSDLLEHGSMYSWVREGHEYHKEHELSTCLFCGSELTTERMALVANAIGDRMGQIARRAEEARQVIGDRIQGLERQLEMTSMENLVVSTIRPAFVEAAVKQSSAVARYLQSLRKLHALLQKKAKVPSEVIDRSKFESHVDFEHAERVFVESLECTNKVIEQHNEICRHLRAEQERQRARLLRHYLYQAKSQYDSLRAADENARRKRQKLVAAIQKCNNSVNEITQQMRAHAPAAETINLLVQQYLGHSELALAPVDSGFQLVRYGEKSVGKPSEGEQTAIVLCYFVAMLAGEGRKVGDLIVVLDDPISSLDSKSLNYAASLIQAKLVDVGQLFVFTHNLQLFNELKKWMKSRCQKDGVSDTKVTASMFLVESRVSSLTGRRESTIVRLPKYLREYESEYHYMFHLLLQCKEPGEVRDMYLYTMPNLLRKVLDVFCSFRQPDGDGFRGRVSRVGKEAAIDPVRVASLERLVQLESHGDNLDDLTVMSTLTVEEIEGAIGTTLELIERADPGHYKVMLKMCGKPDITASRVSSP